MSHSKQKSKKRRLPDSDSPILPVSKRQKLSHPPNPNKNLNRMDQDVKNKSVASLVSPDQPSKHEKQSKQSSQATNININAVNIENHAINRSLNNNNNHIHHHNDHINNNHHIPNPQKQQQQHQRVERAEEKELSPQPTINGGITDFISMSPSTTTITPIPPLLFENDIDINIDAQTQIINNNNIISTPMGFNLSEPEIINVLLQYLDNAGYVQSVKCLSNESGITAPYNGDNKNNIKQWILDGNWEKLMEWFDKFKLSPFTNTFSFSNYRITPQDLFYGKVLILEQKFLELIYQNAKLLATEVMNKELIPLVSPNSKQIFTNIPNLHRNNNNLSDIQLLSQLTNNNNNNRYINRSIMETPIIEMDINVNHNNLYPTWRWNKLCKLLYIDTMHSIHSMATNPNIQIKNELNALNWYNINDSRHKLYHQIITKLVNSSSSSSASSYNINTSSHTLLNIFDEFIKCQLLQSNHFNLRSNSISLKHKHIQTQSNIPSNTQYILEGHGDEITHLSFSMDGEWLISSSNDKRTLIWDFSPILLQNHSNNQSKQPINIVYDILHYQCVTSHALSHNKQYLLTITQYQPDLDDFKHEKERKNYIRRDNDRHTYPQKQQFKYGHNDISHAKYYDYNDKQQKRVNGVNAAMMMDTGRGSNVYLWQLSHSGQAQGHILWRQYHHYRREASVCWCPDSKHYFVTSHGNDIDLYSLSTGDVICTLPSNGNLMTDLLLTHHGYRLCVTLNARDIRVYITDFNVYYNALKKYNKCNKKRKSCQKAPKFIPWLHFTHKNYINLFQNNISNYITKCLYNRHDTIYKWNNSHNDLTQIANVRDDSDCSDSSSISTYSSSTASSSSSLSSSIATDIAMNINHNNHNNNNHNENNKSSLSETESLESMDDKLWTLYEENLELDKKSNGQLRNDMIVSSSISYGGEHEYLIIMVHEFCVLNNNNNNMPIKHPIILMIDLRNINDNINYNNSDVKNNHRNIFNIKFFYGFKQHRFRLQCGFGGFQLPPISKQSQAYQQYKYKNIEKIKENRRFVKHQTQIELKKTLHLNNNTEYKRNRRNTNRKYINNNNNNVNNNRIYGLHFRLNKNELRNLRIPFAQSLQCKNLSNRQNEINHRVDNHYHGLNINKHENKRKNKAKTVMNPILNEADEKEENNKELMISNMIKIALKYPEFLPSKMIQDFGCNINEGIHENDRHKLEPIIHSLFNTLPTNIVSKLYKFMRNKVNINNTNDMVRIGAHSEGRHMSAKKQILSKEILNAFKYKEISDLNCDYEQLDSSSSTATATATATALSSGSLNSLSHSLNNNKYIHKNNTKSLTKYNKENLKKKCFQLKEKRDKFNKLNDGKNNDGRSHYLFQKYIRSQIVNDHCDLTYFSKNIDKLLLKYYTNDEQYSHLSMEMKYFLWHKHLKQQHFNKKKQENYHKISKKKKKKKLKKLQSINIESKIRSAIRKNKKNNHNFSRFLDDSNQNKKRKKKRHKLDKSRRSNEDIEIDENEMEKNANRNYNEDRKEKENENKTQEIIIKKTNYSSSSFSSSSSNNNDSDINEYAALQNTQFVNDELNEINVALYPGYNKNDSVHKLDLNEIETISQLINNKKSKKNYSECEVGNMAEICGNNNSLIQDEYVLNDFFGGHHFIVSGSEDGNVCIWNRITQKIIKLYGHKKSVNCVVWNPVDSFILVSGSDDTQIRVWTPDNK